MAADHPSLKDDITLLHQAFLQLKSQDEVKDFLTDLCTPQEIRALAERFRVAWLLDDGELSYRQISDQTGVSTTTVTRVANFLNNMPHQGYRAVLDRMKTDKKT
ncbi:TrpR-like protein YerC/YecD [Asticcacaulis sp. AC460]|jgi:TrpR-related protein YerC/YecD|uniref:YerC/YecD family TrpR-related protein n=1 Tax=Asticcacaulis sp. AC460 TaxID=1282360 RepID=UPI0003C3ED38|nr:YerC/YecD family TrpR-related protein [Asticcacaulis sp. AC460]ESQ87506.1 TrpR-like protein YerC/YecD [Asticcacaulis sp. AC460]